MLWCARRGRNGLLCVQERNHLWLLTCLRTSCLFLLSSSYFSFHWLRSASSLSMHLLSASLSLWGGADTWGVNIGSLAADSFTRSFSYSLSFSRTFCDSSRRSWSALALPESPSSALIPSHSCLLRSCRLVPDGVRIAAGLTDPIMLRLSQSFSSPSGLLDPSPDSVVSRSCGRHSFVYVVITPIGAILPPTTTLVKNRLRTDFFLTGSLSVQVHVSHWFCFWRPGCFVPSLTCFLVRS